MNNILSIIVASLTISAVASIQTTPLDFNQLATNCQLVVEKNNQKNQKQQELSELTAELENYKQMWWDICYAAMEDPNTSEEEIQYLKDNTFADIDDSQLLADLNNFLQGKQVSRQALPQQPIPDNQKKGDDPETQPKQAPQVVEEPKKEVNDKSGMDPTKKVNDPDQTVKEEKTPLRPDELVKKKKKNNYN